jgi:hypothetical protein
MSNSRQQFEQEALLKVFELQEEITRLRAIIAAPGVCKNCGDSDPFRQAKWGLSTADEFQDAANEFDRLRAENAALAKQLSAAEAKLRAVRERLENIQYHSNMPTHKRDDAYYLRTCCVIAKEQAEAAIHELSKEGV